MPSSKITSLPTSTSTSKLSAPGIAVTDPREIRRENMKDAVPRSAAAIFKYLNDKFPGYAKPLAEIKTTLNGWIDGLEAKRGIHSLDHFQAEAFCKNEYPSNPDIRAQTANFRVRMDSLGKVEINHNDTVIYSKPASTKAIPASSLKFSAKQRSVEVKMKLHVAEPGTIVVDGPKMYDMVGEGKTRIHTSSPDPIYIISLGESDLSAHTAKAFPAEKKPRADEAGILTTYSTRPVPGEYPGLKCIITAVPRLSIPKLKDPKNITAVKALLTDKLVVEKLAKKISALDKAGINFEFLSKYLTVENQSDTVDMLVKFGLTDLWPQDQKVLINKYGCCMDLQDHLELRKDYIPRAAGVVLGQLDDRLESQGTTISQTAPDQVTWAAKGEVFIADREMAIEANGKFALLTPHDVVIKLSDEKYIVIYKPFSGGGSTPRPVEQFQINPLAA